MSISNPQPATRSVVEQAIKDPRDRFSSPEEVLRDGSLSTEDKRQILTSWVKDAELLAEAETENMSGGERPRLQEAKLALAALDESAAKEPAGH